MYLNSLELFYLKCELSHSKWWISLNWKFIKESGIDNIPFYGWYSIDYKIENNGLFNRNNFE